jgi:hypothetical protein
LTQLIVTVIPVASGGRRLASGIWDVTYQAAAKGLRTWLKRLKPWPEIVDLPIENGGSFHSDVKLPEGVYTYIYIYYIYYILYIIYIHLKMEDYGGL